MGLHLLLVLVTIPVPEPSLAKWKSREVAVPAKVGSAEPNLTRGADGRVYLSWIEEGETSVLRFSVWEKRKWSAPLKIAEGTKWFVNWADFPSLAVLADGTIAAHWLERTSSKTYSYGVRISLSRDAGKSWCPPITPHRDQTDTEHGFVSMVPLDVDRFGVFWLDGREMTEHGTGSMNLRYTSLTAGGKLGPEVVLDNKVCECCQTSVARTRDGQLLAVYRDSEDGVRDIGIAVVDAHRLKKTRALNPDGWKIAGCPVNGPAIAAEGGTLGVAWYTAPDDEKGRVQLAFSNDNGERFQKPIRIDDGNPLGRVDVVLLPDGSAVVCWLENTESAAEIRLRRVAAEGQSEPEIVATPTKSSRASGFPRLERGENQLLLVWTDADEPSRVRSIVYESTPHQR